MYMRCLTVVVLGCALSLNAQQDKDERVRTNEPTTVTVYGTRDKVQTEKAETPRRSGAAKLGHGIKSGAAAVGKGVVGFFGWLANVDDDVPRQQDRQPKRSEEER